MPGVTEHHLAKDPFILVAPRGVVQDPNRVLEALRALPLLRYEQNQMIGRQIEAHLTQESLHFDQRFEIGSHLALMTMVARGIGWAITTPLGYMRAGRTHDDVDAFPLPFKEFSRTISLFAGTDWDDTVPLDVSRTMRRLIQEQMISPAITHLPWLAKDLKVLDS